MFRFKTRLATLGLATLTLGGCGGGAPSLIDAVPVAEGEECPNGGVRFDVGIDADGDGVLSADEITDSTTLCNGSDGTDGEDGDAGPDGSDGTDGEPGAAGATTLLRSTDLAGGEEGCDDGGTRFEVGLDNGDGGEAAGDGVLGDGEVDSTEVICNGAPELPSDELDPPAGEAGTAVLDLSGGDAVSGDAGAAGGTEIWASGFRSSLKIFPTGAVDASFTLPTVPVDLGANPLVISSDTTLVHHVGGRPTLSDGDVYLQGGGTPLVWRADGNDEPFDGVHIEAGVTLTIQSDWQGGAAFRGESVMVIDGTLTATTSSGQPTSLYYGSSDLLHITSTGLVSNPGETTFGDANVVVFEGTVDTSGAAPGQSAGDSELQAPYTLWATGQMLAIGADDPSGIGGHGATVRLGNDDVGPTLSAAFIDVSGGDGLAGGEGGHAQIDSYGGRLLNSGEIHADGGDGTSGDGGTGGSIYIGAEGGSVSSSGLLSVDGGSSSAGAGGDGGYMVITSAPGDTNQGSILLSSPMHARGGGGDLEGGSGGVVEIYHDSTGTTFTPVALYGYASIEANGGDATAGTSGGAGGYVELVRGRSDLQPDAGGVVNHVPVFATGGSSPVEAGEGGYVSLYYEGAAGLADLFIYSRAAYDVSGGAGAHIGAGAVNFTALTDLDHEGNIVATGGTAPDGLDGGNGGSVEGTGEQIRWVGDLTLDGGTTGDDATGGSGGSAELVANSLTFEGAFHAAGGDSGSSEGSGGDGGDLWVQSWSGSLVTLTSIDVDGGQADELGERGTVHVDGIDITPAP